MSTDREHAAAASRQGRHHRHRRAARPVARAAAAPRARAGRSSASIAGRFPAGRSDIEHLQVDLRSKKARDVFRAGDVKALIHMGVMHDPRVTRRGAPLVERAGHHAPARALRQYGVPKVVVLSSANVYGPRPDNPQFLTEDAPLIAGAATSRRSATSSRSTCWPIVLLEAAGHRDGDPAAGAHPRRRAQRAVELPAARRGADAARLRSDGAGHPRAGRGRRDRRARSRPACAASSTSSGPARCRCRPSCASSAQAACRCRTRWRSRC